tara:strand:+ start:4045 stop:4749 length:705 start_codon:yes stop_codon:yes gene_type:complete
MNYLEFIFGDDPYISILQFIILILSCVILYFVYSESSKLTDLKSQIGEIEMVCPESKDCPDLVCADNELECPACPDCVLDGSGSGPGSGSTTCPKCPDVTCPSVTDIVDGLFPGRNQGVTVTGKYFPVNAMEEGILLPAYSNFSNLTDAGSNMRMEGTTGPPSQTMGAEPIVPTATTIQPPIAPGGGIMGSAPGANNPQMNPGAMPQASTIGSTTTASTGLPNTPEQVNVGNGN